MKQVILYKTHVWCDLIEQDVLNIMRTKGEIDMFILLHDDDMEIYDKIYLKEVKDIVIVVNTESIKGVYDEGFVDMLVSNHWINMWFYKIYPEYDYYWSTEYDVKILGDSSKLWSIESSGDFMYPKGNIIPKKTNRYLGTITKELDNVRAGFLQFARYSNKAMTYLDGKYTEGYHAQDEIIIFSLMNLSGLVMDGISLRRFMLGTWSCDRDSEIKNHRMLLRYAELNATSTCILHPIKYW